MNEKDKMKLRRWMAHTQMYESYSEENEWNINFKKEKQSFSKKDEITLVKELTG